MKTRSLQTGFSIIEVMVSIVIIMIGLMGVLGMQSLAMVNEFESYQRTQAVISLNNIVDRIQNSRYAAPCYAITTDAANGAPYLGDASGDSHYDVPTDVAGYTCTSVDNAPGLTEDQKTAFKSQILNDLSESDTLLQSAGIEAANNAFGGLVQARACIASSTDAGMTMYTVTVAWRGTSPTMAPTNTCGSGLYDNETMRRVVSTTFKVANLL